MASKNLTWAILAVCGVVLTVAAPTMTQAAEQTGEQQAEQSPAANAKQETPMCRDLDIPGSHIKHHVCGTPAQWSDARFRLTLLRDNPAASHPFGGEVPYSGSTISTSAIQR